MKLRPIRLNPKAALLLYAIAYGVAMMALGGADFTRLYAPSPYHRLQADALLQGHLYIGDSIQQMGHDLAWHAGRIQHVWGLGVGLWLAPFELLWRLCGQKWFPDRIALGVAFALLAAYSGSAAWRLRAASKRPSFAIGFVWLITLCPTLWALNQGGRPVYEETSLYATLVSLGILIAVVRVACFGLRRDLIVCAVLAALSGLMRPTHGIYGMAGMLVCSAVMLKRRRCWKPVLLGNTAFLSGLGLLAVTNWVRLGSPSEFGHRLTISGEMVVYMTRFGNPMRESSVIEAGKELFGWLFLNHKLKSRTADDRAVPGQAPSARWRDPYMTTFDPGWAVVCVAGFAGTLFWLKRRHRGGWEPGRLLRRPQTALVIGTFAWAGLSAGALLLFYLYFPNMSARYPLDLAPAFTAFAVLVWLWVSTRWPCAGLFALAAWLGFGILTAQLRPVPPRVKQRSEIPTELLSRTGNGFQGLNGLYDQTHHPAETGLFGNGGGWDQESGLARSILILVIDRPEFVEVIAGPPEHKSGTPRPDDSRAVMDGRFLPLRSVQTEGDRIRVRFDVPDAVRRRAGNELVFLCFTQGYDSVDRESKRVVHSVRWR